MYFNKVIFFLAFILGVEPLFSFSPTTENYVIGNNSDRDLTIQVKFKDGIDHLSHIIFHDNGNVIGRSTIFSLCGNNTFCLPPNKYSSIIEFIKEVRVAPMKKIRMVIEYLNIYDENNNLIITMDDINEDSFTLIAGDMENFFTMTVFSLDITPEIVEAGRKKYGTTSIFWKEIKPPIRAAQWCLAP